MKHFFIYNPTAGRDNHAAVEALKARMESYRDTVDYTFYPTKAPGDATAFVRGCIASAPDTPLRFYACGGDGTANEVLCGIVGAPNASMTCYPCGSGNDSVKYYGGAAKFLNVDALLNGEERSIDIMKIGDRYALNATHFGFDTAVARTMSALRHKKLIGRKNAYTVGIAKALFTAMKNKCEVEVDGERLGDGKMLLCTISNGKYVGGAYCCAPNSKNDDGLLEVCYVRPLSRLTFVKLISVYKKGEHIDDPRFKKYIEYRQAKSVHITAPEGFAVLLDGEVLVQNDITVEVCPRAIRFVVPAGTLPRSEEAQKQEELAATH
jgi:diacylglycerol kinase (ATP)